MVRLLLLGDLHLSTTGPAIPPACPDLDSFDVDGIVSIGDVIDDNADHATTAAAGRAYEERGRQFFARLNELDVPVIAVPGNHDPVACTGRITKGFENVAVAHRRVVEGDHLPSEKFDRVCFAGLGCEQFHLTPAFRYDRYPSIIPDNLSDTRASQIATETAASVEATVGRFLSDDLDALDAATELGVAPDQRETCACQLDTLAEEFTVIRDVIAHDAETTVVLSHDPPFNVSFDYHHSAETL